MPHATRFHVKPLRKILEGLLQHLDNAERSYAEGACTFNEYQALLLESERVSHSFDESSQRMEAFLRLYDHIFGSRRRRRRAPLTSHIASLRPRNKKN